MKLLHVYFSLEIYGHFTDYGISLVFGGPIFTENSSPRKRVASQGLSHLFLTTFAAVSPDPTDRPWVSEDGS